MAVVQSEPESGRLAYYLRRPDGTEKRLAGDEPEAEDIGRNFSFETSIPGGYANASLDLTRDPRVEYGDFDVYDEFIARGPGNESAFEGYNIEVPNSGDTETSIVSTGWSAYLKDNPTFQEIYRDIDLNRWGSVSAARKILLTSGARSVTDPTVIADPLTGLPALELKFTGAWITPWYLLCDAQYDAGPSARIDRIEFSWRTAVANTAFFFGAFTSPNPDTYSPLEASGDVYTAGSEGTVIFTPATAYRYGLFEWQYTATPAGADGVDFPMLVRNVAVIGAHGLPVSGGGLLGSDVVSDIVGRAAPLLTYTTGAEGSIQRSSFAIPHLIYPEAVTPEEAILQASKYDVPDWGVYNDRLFFWRPSSTGRLWAARQGDPGFDLDDTGKQAEDVYTGVMVQFNDPSGKTFTVGPPGTTGCDYTDLSLQDLSETNPLNERNRKRVGKLVVGPMTTLSGAIQLGARWLEEELSVSDRGTGLLTGFVRDEYGNYEPVWKVRAGDRIRYDDGRERRIIATRYNHEERTNSLTLDSTPHRIEALMAMMEVELVAVGAAS